MKIAQSLRLFRNVWAHADLGELTENEIPFLDDLSRAILEYVYSGPKLVEKVQRRLDEINNPTLPPSSTDLFLESKK
ncbi:hypothetical protein IPdc08_01131 [archaeon]|nr:hypothetical protein IPdc08_01131 [archaeon]